MFLGDLNSFYAVFPTSVTTEKLVIPRPSPKFNSTDSKGSVLGSPQE